MKIPFMLSCRKASRLITERNDRQLTSSENVALFFHLRVCTACSCFKRQTGIMQNALKQWRKHVD